MQSPFFLNIDKPAGITSYDVLRKVKRSWKQFASTAATIGHIGTLDPFAEGLLLVAFNGATKLSDIIHDQLPKTYLAKGILGVQTDSGDLTGKVLQRETSPYFTQKISQFDAAFWQQQLAPLLAQDYYQTPPAFSAAKYQGKKLYQWAREGVTIEKPAVLRKIFKLEITRLEFPSVEFIATVSSGTYIRTLFEDMAAQLGTIGHLETLRRTQLGSTVGSRDQMSGAELPAVEHWASGTLTPEQVLLWPSIELPLARVWDFYHGKNNNLERFFSEYQNDEGHLGLQSSYYWLKFNGQLIGWLNATDVPARALHLHSQQYLKQIIL